MGTGVLACAILGLLLLGFFPFAFASPSPRRLDPGDPLFQAATIVFQSVADGCRADDFPGTVERLASVTTHAPVDLSHPEEEQVARRLFRRLRHLVTRVDLRPSAARLLESGDIDLYLEYTEDAGVGEETSEVLVTVLRVGDRLLVAGVR